MSRQLHCTLTVCRYKASRRSRIERAAARSAAYSNSLLYNSRWRSHISRCYYRQAESCRVFDINFPLNVFVIPFRWGLRALENGKMCRVSLPVQRLDEAIYFEGIPCIEFEHLNSIVQTPHRHTGKSLLSAFRNGKIYRYSCCFFWACVAVGSANADNANEGASVAFSVK